MGKEVVKRILKESLEATICIMVGGLIIMLFWDQVFSPLTDFKEMSYMQGMISYCFLGIIKDFIFD